MQQDNIVEIHPFAIDYSYSEQWQLPALRCQEAWDLIDAIIYEWKESSIAISSPELAAAFNDENKEGKSC